MRFQSRVTATLICSVLVGGCATRGSVVEVAERVSRLEVGHEQLSYRVTALEAVDPERVRPVTNAFTTKHWYELSFSTGGTTLDSIQRRNVSLIARVLESSGWSWIATLVGDASATCPRGTNGQTCASRNTSLAAARAELIRRELLSLGVPAENIQISAQTEGRGRPSVWVYLDK